MAGVTPASGDRLRTPLIRGSSGQLEAAGWEAAVDVVVHRVLELQARYGEDAIGVLGGAALTNEKAYLLGKFARVALGTPNIDFGGCGCVSSGAVASTMAFGVDRGLPFPLEDITQATVILLAGAGVAERLPPLHDCGETRHLPIRSGTDAALANGILHVLVRDSLIDNAFIRDRTDGFEEVRRIAEIYWPERVEEITGVPAGMIVETARRLGTTAHPMILMACGPELQSQGVNNALAYINVALALGAVGRPFSGFGSLAGGRGQGGREHGPTPDELPGGRRIDDEAARTHIAHIWGVPASAIPGPGKTASDLLNSVGRARGLRSLLLVGSDMAVCAPDGPDTRERLRTLDFLVVTESFLSETASLAHVVLPSAESSEEEGTVTRVDGRVLMRTCRTPPPDGVRTDIEILCELGRRLGHRRQFTYERPEAVFDELRRATCGGPADYSGMTYEKILAGDGVSWPCPSLDHPGTPRLFTERFFTESGRARFHAVSHRSRQM